MNNEYPLQSASQPLFRDADERKVSSWIAPWDGAQSPDAVILGAPLSKTSISLSGAAQTPGAVRELFGVATTYNIDHDIDLAEKLTVADAGNAKIHATDLVKARQSIVDAVRLVRTQLPNSTMIVLGGDHSITAPSIEGFVAALTDQAAARTSASLDGARAVRGPNVSPVSQASPRVGLIQFDAHMDLRNLRDGGLTNGTPIRQLLENGTLSGSNIAQIGLHAFANAKKYREYALANGITQITARSVQQRGIASVLQEAVEIVSANTDVIYVTVDMDVLDQAYAPGVPAQVAGGMSTWDLFEGLLTLGQNPKVQAVDFVEVDPTQDYRKATVRATLYGMLTFLTGLALRKRS